MNFASVLNLNYYLQGVFESGQSDVRDDGSAEEVDHQALDPLHVRIVLEDGAGEKEARFRSGGDFVGDKLVQALELLNAELNHVHDVTVECSADNLTIKVLYCKFQQKKDATFFDGCKYFNANKDKCNKKIDVEQTSKDRMVEITLKN